MSGPLLYDHTGTPIVSRRFLKSADNGGGRLPSEPTRPLDPLKKLISNRDWRTVSFLAEKINTNFAISEAIVSQKAMFAVTNGWMPVFHGDDAEWGDIAATWLADQWFPFCDVRGNSFDFNTGLYLDSTGIDIRGESIILLTQSEDGWPQVQRIPVRQIGSWDTAEEKVVGGRYDGAEIENGVIKNRMGRPIAYRKMGENRGEYEDIPAESIIHTFEPKWHEQARGFPIFTACLDEFRFMLQTQDWEMQAMLIASAIGLIEYNDTGDEGDGTGVEDPLGATSPSTTDCGVPPTMKTLAGGLARYFKANGGGKLEQFLHQRPGADWENFNDRMIRVCCAAANWPYPLVWKRDGANGTATRAEQNIARKSIADRQSLLRYPATRMVRYAISVAIKNGILPPYPGSDRGGFLKWDFSMPPLMTIDEGRDRDNDREDAKFGWLTDEEKALRMGTTAKKLAETRDREVKGLIKRAQKIAGETGFEVREVLNMLRQTNPNGAAGMPSEKPNDTPPKQEGEEE